jgi:hypothetical protein
MVVYFSYFRRGIEEAVPNDEDDGQVQFLDDAGRDDAPSGDEEIV